MRALIRLCLLVMVRTSGGLAAGRAAALPGRAFSTRASPAPLMAGWDQFSGILDGSALKGTFERMTDWRVARASHILLKGLDAATVARMEELKAEINNDEEKFAEAAKTQSQCPSRVKGGDLGFFTRGKMVKEFDSVVFSQQPGAVYGPVRTDFGHHLIFLHSCRDPERK